MAKRGRPTAAATVSKLRVVVEEQKKNLADMGMLLAEYSKQLNDVKARLSECEARLNKGDWLRHFLSNRICVLEGKPQAPPIDPDDMFGKPDAPMDEPEEETAEEPDEDSEAADKEAEDECQPAPQPA